MEYYIEDIISQLIDQAFILKEKTNNEFEKGKLFGYYEIISILLNQAEAFGITDKIPLKWRDFKPEELLENLS